MTKFKNLVEQIVLEGMGRPRAKAVKHDNEDMDLNLDDIKSSSKAWKSQGIERRYFTSGDLGKAKAFYTKEENPAGSKMYKYGNGSIVIPKGSDISDSSVTSSVSKFHKSKPKKKSSSKKSGGGDIDFYTSKEGGKYPKYDYDEDEFYTNKEGERRPRY